MPYGTVNADLMTTSDGISSAGLYGFKNRIINGAMQVWQRGTTSSSAGYQTADRWYENASNTTTFAQETSNVPTGFQNAFKMTAGATAQMWIQQPIETKNCYDLRGQTVTVSFVGAASTTTSVTLYLFYSTSADNPAAGSWTAISSSNFSVGTSYGTYSATFTVPSNALTIMPQIITTSTVTSGTIIYITGVQLEKGSTATSFDYRPYGTELQLCQRYLPSLTNNSYFTGQCASTTTGFVPVKFPVTARTAATGITVLSGTNYVTNVSVGVIATTALTFNASGLDTGTVAFSVASGLVAGNATMLILGNTLLFTGCEL